MERRRVGRPCVQALTGIRVLEYRATLAPYGKVAGELGAKVDMPPPPPCGSAVSHPGWDSHAARLHARFGARDSSAAKESFKMDRGLPGLGPRAPGWGSTRLALLCSTEPLWW